MTGHVYDAFVSYRRSDGRPAAQWLRRALESYRAPRRLAAAQGKRLKVYLDTAYERATNDFYAGTIRPALLAARFLIVISTPDAVRRRSAEDWIVREVEDFSNGPHAGNILVALAKGDMSDPLPAGLLIRFPHIEIVDLRDAGRWLALNPFSARRLGSEKLKLLAPLLDIAPGDMPLLRQEEERRQEVVMGAIAGGSVSILTAVAGLSLYAIQNQWRAERALQSSLAATGYSAEQIADGLSIDGQEGQTRAALLNQGCDLIDTLEKEGFGRASIGAHVSCELERARGHEEQREPSEAKSVLERIVAEADAAFARDLQQETFLSLAKARSALAEHELRQKRPRPALAAWDGILSGAAKMEAASEFHLPVARITAQTLAAVLAAKDLNLTDEESKTRTREMAKAFAAVVNMVLLPGTPHLAGQLDDTAAAEIVEAAVALTNAGEIKQARDAIELTITLRRNAWNTEAAASNLEAGRLLAISAKLWTDTDSAKAQRAQTEARQRLSAVLAHSGATGWEREEAQRLLAMLEHKPISPPENAP